MNDVKSNKMNGSSWDVTDPILRLRLAASSCFFGEPAYYVEKGEKVNPSKVPIHAPSQTAYLRKTLNGVLPVEYSNMNTQQMLEAAIDAALAHDPEATLQEAVALRNEDNIRTTPQVILVRAANAPNVRGTGLVKKYASQIVKRADEPAVGLAYQFAAYGVNRPIPNSLKKSWRTSLENFKEYNLGKYRLESKTVKLVDVVNLVHPKSEAIHKLVRGELKNTDKTWEAIISAKGASKESWEEALGVMLFMGILRNLRNFLQHDVDPSLYISKLVDGAAEGKQLPFRFFSAYKAIEGLGKSQNKSRVMNALEECLNRSAQNLPKLPGRTMSLCDNSGSAQGATTSSMGTMKISSIGNLQGLMAGLASEEGHVGVFGDKLNVYPVKHQEGIFPQLQQYEEAAKTIGHGTENGIWLFWDQAIRNKEHWDNVFVFSDMQAGHGGLYGTNPSQYSDYNWFNGRYIDVPKLIQTYRNEVNPNVRVYLVQIAGHQDSIVPEYFENTFILGGWSDNLLKFASKMVNMSR